MCSAADDGHSWGEGAAVGKSVVLAPNLAGAVERLERDFKQIGIVQSMGTSMYVNPVDLRTLLAAVRELQGKVACHEDNLTMHIIPNMQNGLKYREELEAANAALTSDVARYKAVHEAELGVCEQHCDVVAALTERVGKLDKVAAIAKDMLESRTPKGQEFIAGHLVSALAEVGKRPCPCIKPLPQELLPYSAAETA